MHNQRYQRRLMTLARTGKPVRVPEPKPKPIKAPCSKVAKPKPPPVTTEITPEIRAMIQWTAEELEKKIVALEQKRWEARGPEWHAMHERVLAEPKITATGVVKTGIFLTLYTAGVVHLAAFPAMWTHEAYAAIKEKITGRKMPSFEERCIDKGPFYWRREWWQDYDHKAVEEKRQREQAENRRLDDELKRDSRHEYQRALNIVVIQAQKMTGAQTRKEKYAVMREAIAELHGHLEQHHSTSLMSRRSWRL